ncbi:uncharacterized protein LOC135608736 [Musa acuminata AAA Group]|uniref:uncharacterized protein LOC135608736 n=1 Tax=Musa acuminata AAA Group TaxID=214697 RepID=UPI0031CF3B9B
METWRVCYFMNKVTPTIPRVAHADTLYVYNLHVCMVQYITFIPSSAHVSLDNCSTFSDDVKMDKSFSFRDRQVSNAFRLPHGCGRRRTCCTAAAAKGSPRRWPPLVASPTSSTPTESPATSGSTRSTSQDGLRPSRLTWRSEPPPRLLPVEQGRAIRCDGYCHRFHLAGSSPRTHPPSWMLPVPLQPLAWRFTFEMWKGAQRHPLFTNREFTDWVLVDHENIVEASSFSPVQKLDGCVMILSVAKASVR